MYFIFYISFVRIVTKFSFILPGGRTINHINTNKDKDVCIVDGWTQFITYFQVKANPQKA